MHNEEWYRFLETKGPDLSRYYVYGTNLTRAHFTFSCIPGSIIIEDEETSYHRREFQTLVCTQEIPSEQTMIHYQLNILSDPLFDLNFWFFANGATRQVIYALASHKGLAMKCLGFNPREIKRLITYQLTAPDESLIAVASRGLSLNDVDWYAVYCDLCLSTEEINLRAAEMPDRYMQRVWEYQR